MATAPLIADLYSIRCGNCKVVVPDHLITECPTCGAMIDRIVSNHVALADRLLKSRLEAGVTFLVDLSAPTAPANGDGAAHPEVLTAQIIVDLYSARCGACKVVLSDPLSHECPTCGATFDRVVSNHVGLANKLQKRRGEVASTVGRE